MRCKPLPGPREGLNPLAVIERHPHPLCSRYCGPSAISRTEVFLMNPLPDRLNLDHLKKQAKQLLRLYRSRDAAAMARLRGALPAAADAADDALLSLGLRLHDAQSCIARE